MMVSVRRKSSILFCIYMTLLSFCSQRSLYEIFFVVIRITAGVVEALLPIMNGIKEELKNDLTSLKEKVDQQYEVIKCLNETVKTQAEEFEEHRFETVYKLAEIETELA